MSCDLTLLNQRLFEAENALHELSLGKKVQLVQFGANRKTEYTQTTKKDLDAYIQYLKNLILKCKTGKGRQPLHLTGGC